MNHFDRRDEIFTEFAFDKTKRDKHFQRLSKTRQRLVFPLEFSFFVSLVLMCTDIFSKTVTLPPLLLLAGTIMQLIFAVQIDLKIRTLELIDALQVAQQTKDDVASS